MDKYYVRINFQEDDIRFNAFTSAENKQEAINKVMACERYIDGSKDLNVLTVYAEKLTDKNDIMNDFDTYYRGNDEKVVEHLKYPRFVIPMFKYGMGDIRKLVWIEKSEVSAYDALTALNQCAMYLNRRPFTIVK